MADPAPAPNPAHSNTIPPAIRRQAERAEQLQRESLGQQPDAPPANGEAPAAPAPAPAAPSVPQTPQSPPPAPVGDPEGRVRTAEGRLAVEQEKRQQLEGEVNSLRRMVNELQTTVRQAAPPPAAPPPAQAKYITPEEEADYGKDIVGVMKKASREELIGEITSLRNEMADLKGQMANVGTRVAQRDTEDVFSELHQQVPGWVEQNSDDNFIHWLQQPEPFSGIKRHDLLSRAFNSHDAQRVIRFFQGFRAEAAATGQASGQPAPPPPPGANGGKVPLETFAAPGRAAPAQATAPQGERNLYTRAQIAQFYTDKAAGKWRGRESEAAALETDIFRAGPEGRVIG